METVKSHTQSPLIINCIFYVMAAVGTVLRATVARADISILYIQFSSGSPTSPRILDTLLHSGYCRSPTAPESIKYHLSQSFTS